MMSRAREQSGAIVIIALLAGGCASSPPMRYYTLSEIEPPNGVVASANAIRPFRVGRVSIPSAIDRAQLVNLLDANRVQIAEMDRWAAPLDEMIHRVLTANLAARLPAGMVDDFPDSSSRSHGTLSVNIQEFFADAHCAVTLRASWSLSTPKAQGMNVLDTVRVPSVGACPENLPAGMSRAISELSDRMATVIQNSPVQPAE